MSDPSLSDIDFKNKMGLDYALTLRVDSSTQIALRTIKFGTKMLILSKGHYTTFCWIDNNNKKSSHSGWVEYNDSEVHPANIKDVLSSQAYMLLYVDRDLANEI